MVPPPLRLIEYGAKIGRNGAKGVPSISESHQLRMITIASGLALQHLLRQQPFPPQSNQPLGVKIFRMDGPQPHALEFRT